MAELKQRNSIVSKTLKIIVNAILRFRKKLSDNKHYCLSYFSVDCGSDDYNAIIKNLLYTDCTVFYQKHLYFTS